MSRRRTQKKRIVTPDPVYDSSLIEIFVRQIMLQGKKSLAYRIMYSSMNKLNEISKQEPLLVVERAIKNATPLLEVRNKRTRGPKRKNKRTGESTSIRKVSLQVAPRRGTALAIRWIILACRNKSGKTMSNALTTELFEAYKNRGRVIIKKKEIQRMANEIANKAPD